MMSRLRLALLFTIALPSVASAHIHLLQPKSRTDMPTGDQKEQHCGLAAYSRAAHPERVTYFKPGEKIKVMWQETVPHTGWYRISLQPNGAVFAYPPPSNGPKGDGTPSNFPTVNQTGMTDAATGAMVLLDRIPDGVPGTTLMAEVTLPNIECTNCTLQFNQFMTDRDTYTFTNSGAVYFNCADIVISNAAPPPPPMQTPDAGPVTPTPDGGAPVDDGDVKGGCSTSGASGFGLLAAIGLVGLAVRRRRAAR
jgi:MYXO-CTERM domain-containing protein